MENVSFLQMPRLPGSSNMVLQRIWLASFSFGINTTSLALKDLFEFSEFDWGVYHGVEIWSQTTVSVSLQFFFFLDDTVYLIYFLSASISLPIKWEWKYPPLSLTMKLSEIMYAKILANSKKPRKQSCFHVRLNFLICCVDMAIISAEWTTIY